MSPDESDEPSAERVQKSANERRHERTQRVEDMLGETGKMLGEHKYPATSEELATEYGDQEIDLPNETESVGSVFDRLVDERFDSADEAREAIYHELTGPESGPEEYTEGRNLDELTEEDEPRRRRE